MNQALSQHDRHPVLTPAGVIPPTLLKDLRRVLWLLTGGLALLPLVFLVAALILPKAHAQGTAQMLPTPIETPKAGLYFHADAEGQAFAAPELASEVSVDIAGQVARVTVRQRFRNPTSAWLEGLYVFPLPERSAVDRLTMIVGERRIEGEIKERAAAEKAYAIAKAEGKKASPLSSERANVFTTAVANIAPGEEIQVEIQFQDQARFEDGRFELRFPMVVAPRYTPPSAALTAGLVEPADPADKTPSPATPITTLPTSDAGRDLFGPVRHPDEGPANPLALKIRLDSGLPLARIESLYHEVVIESDLQDRQRITLAEGAVPADRDFVLQWWPLADAQPRAAVFGEEIKGEAHLLVSLLPPDPEKTPPAPPRDLILIVDTSGSMYGDSIAQARQALASALARLRPEDRFNLVRFDDAAHVLFPRLQQASSEKVETAFNYVAALEAEGGTNMYPALDKALSEEALDQRLMQVIFITDGAVGNEDSLFRLITEKLGPRRLFTIGIGSAPNSHFMREAATAGRGSFTYIGNTGEVGERMAALFRRLENPALTDLALDWPGVPGVTDDFAEAYPTPLPDLYLGEPLNFTLRLAGRSLADLPAELRLSGKRDGEAWQQRLPLDDVEPAAGVASLWARTKIAQIEAGLRKGADPLAVRAEALGVALDHQLVTRYTSLVAIDDRVTRPKDEKLESHEIARNLPAGWDWFHVFGEMRRTMELRPLPEPLLHKLAASQPGAAGEGIALPRGATPADLQILIGGLALLIGLFLLLLQQRLGRRTT